MTIPCDVDDFLAFSDARLAAVLTVINIELRRVHMKTPIAEAARCERLMQHLECLRAEQQRRSGEKTQCGGDPLADARHPAGTPAG